MAQAIQIPFSFEFRKRSVEWKRVAAQAIALSSAAPPNDSVRQLIAQIGTGDGSIELKLLISHFSDGERRALESAAKPSSGGTAKEALANVDLNVFAPTKQFPISSADIRNQTQPSDAWQMRDDFLRMAVNPDGVQSFLGKWGRWHELRAHIEARELFALQRAVRDALITSPASWFSTRNAFLPKVLSSSSEFPYFALATDICREAICISTTVDLLRQVEFKVCARGDCELPFKVVSKHPKQYCSQYCAHLESVRRNRKAQKATSREGASA